MFRYFILSNGAVVSRAVLLTALIFSILIGCSENGVGPADSNLPSNGQSAPILRVIAYDNGAEDGFAFSGVGEAAVRFTPSSYPAKLTAIRVYWFQGDHEHLNNVQYAVWTDEAGLDQGPQEQVLANTPYVVKNRGGFEDIDVSDHEIVIESGDFYLTLIQPVDFAFGLGLDMDGEVASRSWFNFDGSDNEWKKLDEFEFPYNLVIRAVVTDDVGSGNTGGGEEPGELRPGD